jgi:hypothetical protein
MTKKNSAKKALQRNMSCSLRLNAEKKILGRFLVGGCGGCRF